MKPNAKTVKITLNDELRTMLNNYFLTQDTNQNLSLQKILKYGLQVQNGDYHDQQLTVIQEQIKALNRNHKIINQRLSNIENGLADIDDDILNEKSDLDPLIDMNKLNPKHHN